jgi:uncharacterized protein with GYD domain
VEIAAGRGYGRRSGGEEFAMPRYWALGEHDIVAVMEAPDDETVTAALLAVGSQGNIRTTTMRVFSRDEMRAVIDKAP